MLKKRLTSMLLALTMVVALGSQAFAAEGDTAERTHDESLNFFIVKMFENSDYEILQDDEDISDEFYTLMQPYYLAGDFDTIGQYIVNNQLVVTSPAEFTDLYETSANMRSDVTGAKAMHREGVVPVKDKDYPTTVSNSIVWILDTVISYNKTQNKLLSATPAKLAFAFWYGYGADEEEFILDKSASGQSVSNTRASFWFGVDAKVTIISEDLYLYPLRYNFRADTSTFFQLSEVIN